MRIESGNQNLYSSASVQVSNTSTEETTVDTSKVNKTPQTSENFKDLARKPKNELSFDEQNWIDVIEKANKAIVGATCTFEFSIHEATKEIMVKIIDKDTKEVIREIPPEKILDMIAKMWEMAGIIVDERR